MKGNRLYIIGLLAFLLLVFLYQYFSPKEFVWTPTFNKYDKQPFGSYVFDDVMATSVRDYKVENKTFYQIFRGFEDNRDIRDDREVGEMGEESRSDDTLLTAGFNLRTRSDDTLLTAGFNLRTGSTTSSIKSCKDDTILIHKVRDLEVGDTESSSGEESGDFYDLTVLRSYGLPFEERRAFLITEDRISFAAVDLKALLNLLGQGHKIMLCLSSFPRILCDSIGFSEENEGYYSIQALSQYAREGNFRDSLFFGTDSLRPEAIYTVYPHLHPTTLKEGRSKNFFDSKQDTLENVDKLRYDRLEILVRNNKGNPVAMRLGIGEGELFLVATPLMFTNYGMLDGSNASYAFRLLSYMKELPLTRIEAYGRFANQASGSPLRYFLSQPPLRWALYVAFCTIVLCMVFTAKRRQRAIPVVLPPANETLRFTQLIGNLYYQRKDYKDMLQKKYLYVCTEIKQLYGLDLRADEPDEELCRRLADKVGLACEDIWTAFRELKKLMQEDAHVDEITMMRMIDKMNEWVAW